jgi:hypothetical protein
VFGDDGHAEQFDGPRPAVRVHGPVAAGGDHLGLPGSAAVDDEELPADVEIRRLDPTEVVVARHVGGVGPRIPERPLVDRPDAGAVARPVAPEPGVVRGAGTGIAAHANVTSPPSTTSPNSQSACSSA